MFFLFLKEIGFKSEFNQELGNFFLWFDDYFNEIFPELSKRISMPVFNNNNYQDVKKNSKREAEKLLRESLSTTDSGKSNLERNKQTLRVFQMECILAKFR